MSKNIQKLIIVRFLATLLILVAGYALAESAYTPQYEDEIAAYAYMMKKAEGARLLTDNEMEYYLKGGGAVVTAIVPHDKDTLTAIDPISVRLPDTVDGIPITGFEVPTVVSGRTYIVELVILPDTVEDVTQEPFTHAEVDYIIASDNNPYLTTVMGAVYNKECTQLLWATLQDPVTLRIPDGVVTIRDYALNHNFGNISAERSTEIKADPVEGGAVVQNYTWYPMNKLYLPESLADIGRQYQFERMIFEVSQENPIYESSEYGCLFSKDTGELLTINYYYIHVESVMDKSVTIPEGVEALGRDVLSFSIRELFIPASVCFINFDDDYYWRQVTQAYTVDPGNPTYASVEGVLFSKDLTTLIAYPAYKPTPESTYTIPDGVTTIASSAFLTEIHEVNYDVLKHVIVPESVVTIEYRAFRFYTDEYSIHVPATATDVDPAAFWGDATIYTPEGSAAYEAAMEMIGLNPQNAMRVVAE